MAEAKKSEIRFVRPGDPDYEEACKAERQRSQDAYDSLGHIVNDALCDALDEENLIPESMRDQFVWPGEPGYEEACKEASERSSEALERTMPLIIETWRQIYADEDGTDDSLPTDLNDDQ